MKSYDWWLKQNRRVRKKYTLLGGKYLSPKELKSWYKAVLKKKEVIKKERTKQMAKYLLIIDVNDELLEDYENFYIDYDLRAERKNENVNESIKYVEDCPLKEIPEEREDESCHEYDCCLMCSIGGIGDERCYRCGEAAGYNECLDEILREEDDG